MITKDMLIIDVLQHGDAEKLAKILTDSGLHCLGCALAHNETIEEAAVVHDLDLNDLISKLNEAAK